MVVCSHPQPAASKALQDFLRRRLGLEVLGRQVLVVGVCEPFLSARQVRLSPPRLRLCVHRCLLQALRILPTREAFVPAIVAGEVFTIWANNSVGSRSTTVNITINDVIVSSITYPSENITLTLYHTMTTATPSTTAGTATSWGIHPALPSGLTFNAATGAISGTPEVLQTTTVTYTVWANNSGGSFSDQINITVNDHPPVPLTHFGGNITLNFNQPMNPLG